MEIPRTKDERRRRCELGANIQFDVEHERKKYHTLRSSDEIETTRQDRLPTKTWHEGTRNSDFTFPESLFFPEADFGAS